MAKLFVDSAELRYTQCLWYAWGHIDSGAYGDTFSTDDAFLFAESQGVAQQAYNNGARYYLQSISRAWENYMERERAHAAALENHTASA